MSDGGGTAFGCIHHCAPGVESDDVVITDNCPVCEFSRAIHCFGCGNIDRVRCECEKAETPGMTCCVSCDTWFRGEAVLCGPCQAEIDDGPHGRSCSRP